MYKHQLKRMKIEEVKPYNKEEDKTQQLKRMFNGISQKYDFFNDIMTFGMARRWRHRALKEVRKYPHNHILDIATGTADIAIKAFKMLNPQHITGIDISEKMLEVGREKIEKEQLSDKITLKREDVSQMSFADKTFDVAITSFGIRNFDKLEKSIQEIHRTLKPKGKFVILEMSEPQTTVIKQGYLLFVKTLIPFAVRTFSSDPKAYSYLTDSMKVFPQGKDFLSILERNGFEKIKYKKLFLGVCSLYIVEKREIK